MVIRYTITLELRSKFKEPFGILIQGSVMETMNKLKETLQKENPTIVSVGDTVSRNLHGYGITPQLSITDNKSMRKTVDPQTFVSKTLIKVKNPPGTITEEAIEAIRSALEGKKQIHLLVEGEEDLLTLIAVLYAPENTLVIYGQPLEGIVIIKVTLEKKADAARILKSMEVSRNAKIN
jgi:GTP-dependent dephospho-CoA kinase